MARNSRGHIRASRKYHFIPKESNLDVEEPIQSIHSVFQLFMDDCPNANYSLERDLKRQITDIADIHLNFSIIAYSVYTQILEAGTPTGIRHCRIRIRILFFCMKNNSQLKVRVATTTAISRL